MKTATFTSAFANVFTSAQATTQPVAAATTSTPKSTMIEMLKSVAPIYRTPFLMFYRGYSYEQIATELKLPVGTVKSRIFSARVALKSKIAGSRAA